MIDRPSMISLNSSNAPEAKQTRASCPFPRAQMEMTVAQDAPMAILVRNVVIGTTIIPACTSLEVNSKSTSCLGIAYRSSRPSTATTALSSSWRLKRVEFRLYMPLQIAEQFSTRHVTLAGFGSQDQSRRVGGVAETSDGFKRIQTV